MDISNYTIIVFNVSNLLFYYYYDKKMRLDTQIGKIYALLSVNRRKRVSVLQLHNVSGSLSVATRISQLRDKGMVIENKEVRQKNGIIFSRYRLIKGNVKSVKKR